MKRKALLLIIPFAAAGLAGCERANPNPPGPTPDPQCESATVNIKSAGDVTAIKPGQTLQLTAEVNISGCTFSWSSSDPTIATVDANGLVTGVKAGEVVINYGSGKFNLSIEENPPAPLREISIADAIDLMDKAGDGKVVQEEVVVVGKVLSGSKKDSNGWNGTFEGNKLEFSSARTDGEYSSLDDCTIKVQCYLELYNGKYKIGYLPANVSPTGEKYNPKIISVQVPAGKEVKSVDSVKSAPASVAVGGTVAPSSVTLNVTLEDDTKSTVKATKVEVVTSVAAESVEGKAWYNELGPVTFNIKVVAEAPSTMKEAYLAAEALTDSKAKTEEFTFSGVIVGKRTNKNDKGEVEFFVQDGSYAIDLFNPTNKDSLAVGNRVTVTSTLCNYNGTIETTSDLKSVVVEGNADLPEATFIDSAATLSSTKVSVLANTEGVIKTIPAYSATADAKVVVTVGSDDINVFFKKNFIADFESIYKSLAVGDKITLTNGVVGDYKGRQILVIDGTQITKGETPDPGEPAINLDKYSATIAKDGEVTLTATVYNSEESVSWSIDSGEGNVAITPNGKTCVVKGVVANSSAVVKATLGTTGKSKTCNVTVKADSPVIEGIVLDFAELSKVSDTVDGVSYASAKASGASEPAYNSSNKELRLYAKNTFTISGTNITKITFDYNGCYTEGEKDPCHKATGDIVSASVGSVSAGVWTGSADSVTFTMSDSGQVHVHKVGVVCAAAKTVLELTVKTQPNKVAYNEGESFSAAGLVLHAVYSDSSEEDITSGWTISPDGALAPTDNKVVVSYGGKSVDVNITVTARELQSIVIDTQPSKVNYVEGESFDPAGMVVKAIYNIGDPAVITNYTYSPDGALELSDDKVVVSYNGKTAPVDITVSEAPEVLASKFTFTAKDAFEESGKTGATMAASGTIQGYEGDRGIQWNKNPGVVTISDFPSELVIKKIIVDASTNSTASDVIVSAKVGASDFGSAFTMEKANHVDVTFEGSASGSTITINTTASAAKSAYIKSVEIQWEKAEPAEPAVNGVTVSPKTASLDLTETTSVTLSATVDAVGGASEDVVWSIESGDDYVSLPEIKTGSSIVVTAAAEGTAVVKVASSFDPTKYDTCEVSVLSEPAPQPELGSISVDASKAKTTYTEGESVVKDGLVVTAHYTNGGGDKVLQAAEYSVSPSGALTTDDKTVTVSYTEGGKTVSAEPFAITVNPQTAEKGEEGNPYTATEAAAECSKLGKNCWSSKRVYVTGTVKSFDSSKNNNCTITDGVTDFIVYKSDLVSKTSALYIGDVVVFEGFLENYNGNTPEMTSLNDGTHNALPTLVSFTRGTSAISLDAGSSANADVTLNGTSDTNGATHVVNVVAKSGYEIVSVTANNVDCTNTEGSSYSFVVSGPTSIKVITKDAGTADPEVYKEMAFTIANCTTPTASYVDAAVYKNNGFEITAQNFNTNAQKGVATWDLIKCGRKNAGNESVAYIANTSAIDKEIVSITITFDTCNTTALNEAYILIANNKSMTGAEKVSFEVSGGSSVTVQIPAEKIIDDGFYQIVFDCGVGSANGYIAVSAVAYNYIPE